MKIDDANATGLKGLVNRQRNLVVAKERELENVRNYYDAKKEADRLSGQKEVIEIQDANQKEILAAIDHKTTRLEDMRTSLQKDLGRLENERAILSQQDALEKEASIARMNDEQAAVSEEALERSREIGQKANQEIAELQKESQFQLAQASVDARNKYDKQIQAHDASLADKMREQRVQVATREIEHNQKLNQLKSEFERNAVNVTRTSAADKVKKEQLHLKELKTQEDQYNYLLNEKRKQFEQKFAHLEKEHNTIIQRTESRFKQQLEELSKKYSSIRDATVSRAEDPFYNLNRLNHRLENTPDAYLVHVEVPEHEAESVLLSGHKRSMKLTLNRRYSERLDGKDGYVDINKRSETFTQEFPVTEIIDDKEISRKYENGVLTFRVAKA